MTISISFSDTTVRVAVELNGAIESVVTYLPEREWVGLTKKERDDVWYSVRFAGPDELAKAIEAKLREKNGGAA